MAWPYHRLLVEKHTKDPKEEKEESGLVIQKHTEGLGPWRRNGLGTHVADIESTCGSTYSNSNCALQNNGWARECKLKTSYNPVLMVEYYYHLKWFVEQQHSGLVKYHPSGEDQSSARTLSVREDQCMSPGWQMSLHLVFRKELNSS